MKSIITILLIGTTLGVLSLYILVGNPFTKQSDTTSRDITIQSDEPADSATPTDDINTQSTVAATNTPSDSETVETTTTNDTVVDIETSPTDTISPTPTASPSTPSTQIPSYFADFTDCSPGNPENYPTSLAEISEETVPSSYICMGEALANNCEVSFIADVSTGSPENNKLVFIQPRGQSCEIGYNITNIFNQTLSEPQIIACDAQKIFTSTTGNPDLEIIALAETAPGSIFTTIAISGTLAMLDSNSIEKFSCRTINL